MSALGELVLVLAGLHAALGLHWFPRSAYVFRAFAGRSLRCIPASAPWGSDRMALLFGPPLSGTGRFHLVELSPVAMGREVIVADAGFDPNPGGRTPKSGRVATWEEARGARAEGRHVRIGKREFVTTGSDALARHLARTLARLAQLEPAAREREVEQFVRESLDETRVRERSQAWEREARRVRWPALFTFVLLFVALPAIGFTIGLGLGWPILALGLVVAQTWSSIAFFCAHRRLDADERGERVMRTLTVALSPIEALRAAEILGRDLLAKFHPFAAGAVLLDRPQFELFAERIVRDALYPMPADPSDDSRGETARASWRGVVARELEGAARRLGLDAELATRSPARDADEHTYCPRCLRTYVLEVGGCAECWGLPLRRFDESTRP